MGDSDRATAIRACSFATHYVPSFFRMPARFGALVSAFLFVFMALWSSVGAECCGNSLQKLGLGGGTDCPCPTEPPCNRQPTVRIKDLHDCNLFGCNCDECDATKLCPQIPAGATADVICNTYSDYAYCCRRSTTCSGSRVSSGEVFT